MKPGELYVCTNSCYTAHLSKSFDLPPVLLNEYQVFLVLKECSMPRGMEYYNKFFEILLLNEKKICYLLYKNKKYYYFKKLEV